LDDAEEVVGYSLGGARWMLWLSASALACGFGTNVVLGRAGPELLGFYGFLTLTVSLISVFFVLGGSNVLVNYLPKRTPADKLSFLGTYAGIVLASALLFLGLAAAFPALLDLVYGTVSESSVVGYLALFLPLGVLQTLAWSALQADLDLRVLAVSHQLVSSLNFVFLLVVALGGWLDGEVSSARRYVLLSMLVANAGSLGVALWRLWTKQVRKWERFDRPYLPAGFWRFSLFFHASTLVQFAVRSLDQVYVLRELGFVSLGYYRSALVLANLANFLLAVTDRAFYGTFCNVDEAAHPRLHGRFVRLNTIGTALVGLVLLLFSQELLKLFGESATGESRTVLMLIAGGILVAFPITSVNNALVAARERMNLIFANNVFGAIAAVVLYETLGGTRGLVGIGWAFAILQVLMLIASSLAARRAAGVPFPLSSWLLSLTAAAAGAAGGLLLDHLTFVDFALKAVLAAAFLPAIVAVRLVTMAELRDLAALLLPGRWTAPKGAAA
jgi:O-antigen/teichoic acid export membrane protein